MDEHRLLPRALDGEEHLVEQPQDRGVEILLVRSLLALKLAALRVFLRDPPVSFLCGVELPGGILDAPHCRPVSCEDTEVVLLAQPFEEALYLLRWNLGIGADDRENASAAHLASEFVELWQRQYLLVDGLAHRLEHLAQAAADQVVDLDLRCVVGEVLEQLCQVLLTVEVEPVLRRVMQVPGGIVQLLERTEELGRFA